MRNPRSSSSRSTDRASTSIALLTAPLSSFVSTASTSSYPTTIRIAPTRKQAKKLNGTSQIWITGSSTVYINTDQRVDAYVQSLRSCVNVPEVAAFSGQYTLVGAGGNMDNNSLDDVTYRFIWVALTRTGTAPLSPKPDGSLIWRLLELSTPGSNGLATRTPTPVSPAKSSSTTQILAWVFALRKSCRI